MEIKNNIGNIGHTMKMTDTRIHYFQGFCKALFILEQHLSNGDSSKIDLFNILCDINNCISHIDFCDLAKNHAKISPDEKLQHKVIEARRKNNALNNNDVEIVNVDVNDISVTDIFPATTQNEIANPSYNRTVPADNTLSTRPEENSIKRPASLEFGTKNAHELLNNLNDNCVNVKCNSNKSPTMEITSDDFFKC